MPPRNCARTQFNILDTRVVFCNSHLAAHQVPHSLVTMVVLEHRIGAQDRTDRRNQDVAEVLAGLSRTSRRRAAAWPPHHNNTGVKLGKDHFDLLHQFHHTIWMGDLNYRCAACSRGALRRGTCGAQTELRARPGGQGARVSVCE